LRLHTRQQAGQTAVTPAFFFAYGIYPLTISSYILAFASQRQLFLRHLCSHIVSRPFQASHKSTPAPRPLSKNKTNPSVSVEEKKDGTAILTGHTKSCLHDHAVARSSASSPNPGANVLLVVSPAPVKLHARRKQRIHGEPGGSGIAALPDVLHWSD
jgi:hypothetical protein